jgi:hypothetical protein
MTTNGVTGSATPMTRARQLMREGSLDAADAILRDVLGATPSDANALYLRGVIASRRHDHGTAVAVLRQAVAVLPAAAPAWLALGNAYGLANEHALAADAYRQALVREPGWFDARYNLGLAFKRLGDLSGAARMFHAAWLLDPSSSDAAKQCVDTIAAWVRADRAVPAVVPAGLAPTPPSVCIVACSIDAARQRRVEALYRRLFAEVEHEIVVITGARSLAEAYNRAIRQSASDIVVLSHDDVDILAPDFAARLLGHLRHFDAVGVAGSVQLAGPAPLWSGRPHLRGWITHRVAGEPAWRADVLDPRPVAGDIAVLDGVLLAGRREVFAAVPFDAATFVVMVRDHTTHAIAARQVGIEMKLCDGREVVSHLATRFFLKIHSRSIHREGQLPFWRAIVTAVRNSRRWPKSAPICTPITAHRSVSQIHHLTTWWEDRYFDACRRRLP